MLQETTPDIFDELLGAVQERPDTNEEAVVRGLSNAIGAAGSFPAGAIEFLGIVEDKVGDGLRAFSEQADALSFLDPLGEDLQARGEALRTAGQVMSKAAVELIDQPESKARGGLAGFLSQDFASAGGSLIPLLAFGGAPALGMLMSGAAMGAQEYAEQETRDPDDELKMWGALLGGLGLGATEWLPVSRMLTRINARSGGQLKRIMVDRLIDGGEEAAQEMFQTFGSNAIAKFIGEEDRDLSEGVLRAGTAGGAVAVLTGIAGSGINTSLGSTAGRSTDTDFGSVGTSVPGDLPPGFQEVKDPSSIDSAPIGSLPRLQTSGGDVRRGKDAAPGEPEVPAIQYIDGGITIEQSEGEVQFIPPMEIVQRATAQGLVTPEEGRAMAEAINEASPTEAPPSVVVDENGKPSLTNKPPVAPGAIEDPKTFQKQMFASLEGLRKLGFIRLAKKGKFTDVDTTDPESLPDSGKRAAPREIEEGPEALKARVLNTGDAPAFMFDTSSNPFPEVEPDISDGTELSPPRPDPLASIRGLLPQKPSEEGRVEEAAGESDGDPAVLTAAAPAEEAAGQETGAPGGEPVSTSTSLDEAAESDERKKARETARRTRDTARKGGFVVPPRKKKAPKEAKRVKQARKALALFQGSTAKELESNTDEGPRGQVIRGLLDEHGSREEVIKALEGEVTAAATVEPVAAPEPAAEPEPALPAATVPPGRAQRIDTTPPVLPTITADTTSEAKVENLSQADIDEDFLAKAAEAGKKGDPEDEIQVLGAGIMPLIKLPGIEAVRRFYRKNLRPRGDRPESLDKIKRRSENWYTGQMEQVQITNQTFEREMKKEFGSNAKDADVASLIDDALKDPLKRGSIKNKNIRGLLQKMRDHIDLLSRTAVRDGVVEGPMALRFSENQGFYVTRSFRVHSDPKHLDNLDPRIRNNFKAFLRSEYISNRRAEEIQKKFSDAAERSVGRQLKASEQRRKRLEQFSKGELKQIVKREKAEFSSLKRLAERIRVASPDQRAALKTELNVAIREFEAGVKRNRIAFEKNLANPDIIAGGQQAASIVADAKRQQKAAMDKLRTADNARQGTLNNLLRDLREPRLAISTALLKQMDAAATSATKALQAAGSRLDKRIATEQRNTLKRISETRFRGQVKAAVRIKKESAPVALTMTEAELDGFINSIIRKRQPGENPLAALSQKIAGSKQLGTLKRRRELAPQWLELLGENREVRTNYATSVANMAQLVTNHRFLTEAREAGLQGGFFHEKPIVVDGISYDTPVGAADNPALIPLVGKKGTLYTTPEIKEAMLDAFSSTSLPAIVNGVIKANGFVKLNKTVLSVMTHVRNYIGNAGFALASGHINPVSIAQESAKAARRTTAEGSTADKVFGVLSGNQTRQQWEAEFTRASELGVVSSGAASGEVRKLTEEVWGDRNQDPAYLYANKMERVLRQGIDKASQFYQLGDDAWKLNGFRHEKARMRKAYPKESQAQIEERAAERVLLTYTDYSRLPRAVQFIRRVPFVGAFVAFPTEIVRISGNTVRLAKSDLKSGNAELRKQGAQRMMGALAAATIPQVLCAAARVLSGLTRDDDEDARMFVPPWSENSCLMWMGRDEDGVAEYIDISYVDPFSYIKKPIMALLRGLSDGEIDDAALGALGEASEPWIGEDIMFGAITDVLRNKKPTGGRVFDEAASWDDKALEIGEHLMRAAEPGTISSARRIAKGLNDEVATYGRKYDFETEMWAVFTGMRRQKFEISSSLSFLSGDFQRDWNDSSQTLSQTLKTGTLEMSDDEIRDVYERTEGQRREAWKKIYKASQGAMSLGATPEEVEEALRTSLSKKRARSIMEGRYEPYVPSSSFMRTSLKRADRERADEFQRRIEVLRGIADEAETVYLPED